MRRDGTGWPSRSQAKQPSDTKPEGDSEVGALISNFRGAQRAKVLRVPDVAVARTQRILLRKEWLLDASETIYVFALWIV